MAQRANRGSEKPSLRRWLRWQCLGFLRRVGAIVAATFGLALLYPRAAQAVEATATVPIVDHATPTPTACPDCVLLGSLSVSGPTVDPPRPAVGAQVTLTFPVSAALPGGFDCEHCVFEGGEGYLAGEDPPVEVGDTVVVQRRVVRAGSTTVQLHARETTEEQCYFADPGQGCGMFFQYAFIEASSPPFVLQLGETICAGDCDGNGEATVDEVVLLVNIALGETAFSTCPAGDASGDSRITIDELIGAVASVLEGCPSAPVFAVRGTVTEFPNCTGFMRGITVVLDPLGLTTRTAIGPDPGVAGTFAFDDVPPGDYTLTISPSCNPSGCWPPTPVRVVDRDVEVLICNSARCGDQEVMDRFPSCIAAETEAPCLAAGGVWTPIGIRLEPECVCPTGQEGCACNRSTDCLGACSATLAGVPAECSTVQGVCAGEAPIVGCRCWFDEGGDARPLCVD